jgi:hypothetical protein
MDTTISSQEQKNIIEENTSDNCFICLDNTSNRVCGTCKCYGCPDCWVEYCNKDKSTDIDEERVYHVNCPICRQRINLDETTSSIIKNNHIVRVPISYYQDVNIRIGASLFFRLRSAIRNNNFDVANSIIDMLTSNARDMIQPRSDL